ncbi:hypothetical protein CHGG_01621 [Chaetomium globosum CBS 148.51]|uniref:Uncharacterized protein n=1 Tax=Chaetomium globosum (strain ATCC 6205 / CBS 148.51 / DSM 1962 / NBRC 6347 / NRRL 1970) TaxID=306901 RepID=Q2HDT3_CHAGB|nr:uncharacterized protein CHGG_01621 [Chaetomium globosum CBS 148.51]EAQ93386.1 hypothetical protein CHGG_01621 [Chaetomium globosum CBS 148.51]
MGGLIPLMLGSGSRTGSLRPKPQKRLSLPAPAPLPVLPYTKAEWRKTIAEVKRKYFGKRYRACSARCIEVLEGIRDTSQVEPVYLIYLHFYAATSLEICARPLPSTAPLRATLLQQARTHFERASVLINTAEESVLRKFRPGSVGSSRGSSCHSPSSSISSRAWTPDTVVSSPTDSDYSMDDQIPKSPRPPPRHRKKVSFSLPEGAPIDIPTSEPIIRPDSPTLGFDDGYYHSSISSPTPPEDLPAPMPVKFQEIEVPLPTIPELAQEEEEEEEVKGNDDDEYSHEYDAKAAYHVARSVDRCCEHLAHLRAQLARHSTSLDQLLQAQQQAQTRLPSNSPTSTRTAADATEKTPTAAPGPGPRGSEARAQDRQARVERLRKIGWQRRRFDSSPYEALCEAVLAEMA